jgi:hypothetical protein
VCKKKKKKDALFHSFILSFFFSFPGFVFVFIFALTLAGLTTAIVYQKKGSEAIKTVFTSIERWLQHVPKTEPKEMVSERKPAGEMFCLHFSIFYYSQFFIVFSLLFFLLLAHRFD